MADSRSVILASASPRRRQLLASMGLSFEVAVPDIDENALEGEAVDRLARRLSLAKAEAVAATHVESVIIAADTIVVIDGHVLGKPSSEADAIDMLARLRDQRHLVYSGLALVDTATGRRCQQVAITPVYMRNYADKEILRYVAGGGAMDKAGAYAIQDAGFVPVARIGNCYANVMGLPLCHLYRALVAFGVPVPTHPLDCCPLAVEKGCAWAECILQSPQEEWCG